MSKILIKDFSALSEEEQFEVLSHYQDTYINGGDDQIDDATFDVLQNIYEEKTGLKWKEVGALPLTNKANLPYYMGSLDKAKGKTAQEDINRWSKSYNGPWILEDKIDGNSGLYVVKHTDVGGIKMNIQKLYTRGDGKIGSDITHLIPYMNLPVPDFDIAVRGEIVIPLNDFEEYNRNLQDGAKLKNARNACAGVINSKEINETLAKKLRFYAYNIIDWSYNRIEQETQLKYLEAYRFDIPWNMKIETKNLLVSSLEEALKIRRKDAPYDIDGLVLVDNKIYEEEIDRNPRYMLAFKVDVFTQTVVTSVEWDASKDGILKPVVIYEPINISGVTMSRASGKNAKFIVNNKIGPGAIILVTRAGDVIPDIVECLKGSDSLILPDEKEGEYMWNETEVEFILKDPSLNMNVQKEKIVHFIRQLDIKNVGPGRVALLYDYGYDTLYKMLNASISDMSIIQGLGDKSAQQIYDNIHSVIKAAPLAKVMSASGIFGSGFGTRKMELIVEEYPNILEMSSLSVDNIAIEIQKIPGFDKTAYDFAEKLELFVEWLNLHYMIKIIQPLKKEVYIGNGEQLPVLNNMKIVFTGFRSGELEEKIKLRGGSVVTSISKNTNILVAKNLEELKTKGTKAKDLGIEILTKDEFVNKYKL
jgi:DNA ligase (NAD+)